MEASMMRPDAKKRQKPPKPPPKPSEIKRKDPERPTALMPPRPADAELSHTQHRMRKAAAGNNEVSRNVMQTETKEKTSKTPVAPPRSSAKELNAPARHSQRHRSSGGENVQSEASKEEDDLKQNNQTFLGGMFRRSHKENISSFTSYVTDGDKEEKSDDVTTKQAPGTKLASKEPSPEASTEEPGSDKQRSTEKSNQEKIAEPKQDIGGLIAGIFRKTPKEKSFPALTVSKADGDPEKAEEATEKSAERSEEKGGLFSGKPKNSSKLTDEAPAQENLSVNAELSASSDCLSENGNNKEKGGIFSGMFKKSPKPVEAAETDKDQQSLRDNLSGSNDNLSENSKEKGAFFSGILRKSPKMPVEGTPGKQTEPSDSSKTPSENNTRDKGGIFSGMFKKSPKMSEAPRLEEGGESLNSNLSASSDSLSDNKEKGGLFSGLRKKTPKTTGEENLSAQKDLSASSDSLSEAANTMEKQSHDGELSGSSETLSENTKEKGGIFSGLFKKAPKPAEPAQPDEEDSSDNSLSKSNENVSENKEEKGGGLFGGLLKKTPKASGDRTELLDKEAQRELSGSTDDLSENSSTKEKNIFSNMFKKPQKPTEDTAADKGLAREKLLTGSCENLCSTSALKEKKGGLAGIFKRSASIENLFDEDKGGLFSGLRKKTPKTPEFEAAAEDKDDWPELLRASNDSLSENTKEKTGGLTGIFKKSPKPAPRSTTSMDPLRDSEDLSSSRDSLTETSQEKKGGLGGIFRRTPKTTEQQLLIQDSESTEKPEGGGLRRTRTIKKKRRVVSFRVKKTQMPKLDVTLTSDKMPAIEEAVELQDLNPAQESSEELEVQSVEMAAYPTEHNPAQAEVENDELMEWWNTVKGWVEWNESSNFQGDEGHLAMEQAADRVYMAARLFVRLFNQRGASLQQRILELLALADAADQFHKKTVSAAVGGGVASVAGSLATITGLILAPFTFGASIIVTAVGIGVATAGSITAATANITDTVHSNMDRKKLEKMIQGYQEEIKVIRECMEFVQAGMDTLEDWDFEKYSESAAKKAMNHNLKHVMKEGGRAGKALMVNTDKLISTVQILGAAGGAAKAAQAISVTTGVMSALFLALDVFFLAKDSHELRKGAKTKFASKIRDVCKELQDGLLELNKVKTQLQKTMDGIEVEEYEEIEEVEMEVDDDFESDPKKLAELEHELDLLEEKLDKKAEEVEKSKETDKQKLKNEETSLKETGETKGKKDKEERKKDDKKSEKKGKVEVENKFDSTLEKISNEDKEQKNETFNVAKEEVLKEQSEKGKKKDKETENRLTAGKEKNEVKKEMPKEDGGSKSKTHEKEKERNKTGNDPKETKSRSGQSKQDDWSGKGKMEKESESSKSGREGESVMNEEKEVESGSLWRHSSSSSSSDKGRDHRSERGSKHETKERVSSRQSNRTESWRRAEAERGKRDGRGEMGTSREERRESNGGKESKRETKREDHGRESHHRHEASWMREPREGEGGGRREESDPKRSHHRRGHDDQRATRDEKRGSEMASERASERSPFERAGAEERGKRNEEGESQRRERETRGGDREHGHGHRGSRRKTSTLLEDGLNI